MAEGEDLYGEPALLVREAPVCVCVHAWNCGFVALLKAHQAAVSAQPASPRGAPRCGAVGCGLGGHPTPRPDRFAMGCCCLEGCDAEDTTHRNVPSAQPPGDL